MAPIAQILMGGRGNDAARIAARQAQMQRVADDRQLASENAAEATASPSRAIPRGRRLFVSQDATGMQTTLG